MRKLLKVSFLFLFLLSGCSSFNLSNDELLKIEEEDDNLCKMEGVSFDSNDTRKIYWQCRLRIVSQRIYNGPAIYDGYGVSYKNELRKMRRAIKRKIKKINKQTLFEISNFQEEKEHNYCVLMKEREEVNDNGTFDYFKCRDKIKNLKKNDDNYSNLSNESVFKMFEYKDQVEKKKKNNVLLIQNECVKYASSVEKLEKCEKVLKKIEQCTIDIKKTTDQRKIDDKQFCAKNSIEKYPDLLSKFEGTGSIPLGPKINKIELLNLREKATIECLKARAIKLNEYEIYLKNECKIKNLKILEEK